MGLRKLPLAGFARVTGLVVGDLEAEEWRLGSGQKEENLYHG